jgi:hypothetical protein
MNAREKYGPPMRQDEINARIRELDQGKIYDAASGLRQHGVTQGEGFAPSHLSLVKNNDGNREAQKNLAAPHGQRPALTPDDGAKQQARQIGNSLQKSGVSGGQSLSAEERFAPSRTPNVEAPKQGRGR